MRNVLIVLCVLCCGLILTGCMESYRWTEEVDVTENVEEGYRLVFKLDKGTHHVNIKSNVDIVIEIADEKNNVTEFRTPALKFYDETLNLKNDKLLYVQNEWGSGGTATVIVKIDKKIF